MERHIRTVNCIALFFLLLCPAPVHGERTEVRMYRESRGDVQKDLFWSVTKSETARLVTKRGSETNIIRTNDSCATLSWKIIDPEEDREISVHRKGDRLCFSGVEGGTRVSESEEIDEAPWYQATSWSLRPFVLCGEESTVFWTVRPKTLEAYKLKARKIRVEEISIQGRSEKAQRVELSPAGVLSLFWKSSYWFRKEDGVFLKYKGPAGLPGSETVVIELHKVFSAQRGS